MDQFYDAWPWQGTSSYVAGTWLAALAAGKAMAEAAGDAVFVEECSNLLAKARRVFEEKLWNGGYYRLWSDAAARAPPARRRPEEAGRKKQPREAGAMTMSRLNLKSGRMIAALALAIGLGHAFSAQDSGSPRRGSATGRSAAQTFDRANQVGRRVEGSLRVGMAAVDITPDWPVFLPYGKSVPVTARFGDPCYAKAVVFEVGDLQVAFVELDIIGIRIDAASAVKARIEKDTGIPKDLLVLAATHNHAYPRVADQREEDPGKILRLLAERSSAAVKQATQRMFPARIGVVKATLRRDLVSNREKLMGPTLTDLHVIRIDDLEGNLRGVLYNFGAHPVVFTKSWGPETPGEIGPDWPGLAGSYIETRWALRQLFPAYNDAGKDYPRRLFTMFSLGAAGDQVGLGKGPTVEEKDGVRMHPSQVMAQTVADRVLELVERVTTTDKVRMAFRAKTVSLSFKRDLPDSPYWKRPPTTLVQALIFNEDTGLLLIPGELTADLGMHIRDCSALKHCILVTQANDSIGYITSPEEALEEVTYAGKGSAFDHTRGQVIVEEAIRLVNSNYDGYPLFDLKTGFGSVSGRVNYAGGRRLVVGVLNKFEHPSQGGPPFWGKRTLVDSFGNYRIDRLLPGRKFLYVREIENEAALREKGHEGKTFFYGRQVFVRAGEATEPVDFHISKDRFVTGVKSLSLDEEHLQVVGNTITGRLRVEGEWKENESILADIHFYGAPVNDPGLEMANPFLSVPVSRQGKFRFEGMPPGRFQVVCWLDVNRNGYPEPGVDLVAGPSNKILEVE